MLKFVWWSETGVTKEQKQISSARVKLFVHSTVNVLQSLILMHYNLYDLYEAILYQNRGQVRPLLSLYIEQHLNDSADF